MNGLQYFNRRLISIFFLGFSSGLPLALVSSTLLAWYAVSGVDVVTIGLLALVGQPYVFKFFWAPFIDRFLPPLLGRRRGWILLTQLLLTLLIVIMSYYSPSEHPALLASLAFICAFLSASQDIAIDAYRTDLLNPDERGLGAAVAVGGYRIAMLVSGGLALIFADQLGWHWTYFIMALLMLLMTIVTWFSPEIAADNLRPATLRQAVVEPFREFMSRKHALAFLLLIILYKLGEAFTSSSGLMTNVFLLQGLGFSLTTVGTINKGFGLIATLVGVFSGGVLMTRIGLFSALLSFGILQAVSNLSYMWLAIAGKSIPILIFAIAFDNFSAGLGTAAVVALIMSLCDARYSATQFALLSSLSAVGRVLLGPFTGVVVSYLGWVQFFLWTFVVALPAIILLWWLRLQESSYFNLDTME